MAGTAQATIAWIGVAIGGPLSAPLIVGAGTAIVVAGTVKIISSLFS